MATINGSTQKRLVLTNAEAKEIVFSKDGTSAFNTVSIALVSGTGILYKMDSEVVGNDLNAWKLADNQMSDTILIPPFKESFSIHVKGLTASGTDEIQWRRD